MRAYQDMVYSTAVRLTGNSAQAEDIAQEVFLRAYEHFANLRTSVSAGGWLKTVATRLSLTHLTRYRRRWRLFSELEAAEAEDESPEVQFPATDDLLAELTAEDRARVVESALARLPERQRVPLVLFHFGELPYEAIARELGVSLAKVKTDMFRGRAALAAMLTSATVPHDLAPPTGAR